MDRRSKNVRTFLRLYASGSLLVWLAAFTVCTGEIFCAPERCEPATAAHHEGNASENHHEGGESEHHQPHDNSFCSSLKAIDQIPQKTILVPYAFHVSNCDLFSLYISLLLAPIESSESHILRQREDLQLLRQPEVFLGPAFHSLAPPLLG